MLLHPNNKTEQIFFLFVTDGHSLKVILKLLVSQREKKK